MKHLLIENKGELDISSLILLGASTKRNDKSKIGFFGSGNKYAIATLLKESIPFKIFSGEREVEITTEDVSFRDLNFKKIIIDGMQTSLTTDMGPQWKPWMAVREWVSNSIDEGGNNIVSDTESVCGRDGYTRFFVEHHPLIQEMIDNWDSYFTFDRTDYLNTSREGKIFPQTDPENNVVLYRKGIRAFFDRGTTSLFQYDLSTFEINESRLIDSLFNAEYRVIKELGNINNVSIATAILNKAFIENTWEARLPWRWGINSLNSVWREAIGKHNIIVDNVSGYFIDIQQSRPCYIVSIEMAQQIRKSFPDVTIHGLDDGANQAGFKKVETTAKQEFLLKQSLEFLKDTNYDIHYDDVEIVQFDESSVLGRAFNNKILLADKLFDSGKRQIVLTIIEENEHLKTGFKDCSRQFQNHLFEMFLTEKEERFANFL
jgi:hypothetical protein